MCFLALDADKFAILQTSLCVLSTNWMPSWKKLTKQGKNFHSVEQCNWTQNQKIKTIFKRVFRGVQFLFSCFFDSSLSSTYMHIWVVKTLDGLLSVASLVAFLASSCPVPDWRPSAISKLTKIGGPFMNLMQVFFFKPGPTPPVECGMPRLPGTFVGWNPPQGKTALGPWAEKEPKVCGLDPLPLG